MKGVSSGLKKVAMKRVSSSFKKAAKAVLGRLPKPSWRLIVKIEKREIESIPASNEVPESLPPPPKETNSQPLPPPQEEIDPQPAPQPQEQAQHQPEIPVPVGHSHLIRIIKSSAQYHAILVSPQLQEEITRAVAGHHQTIAEEESVNQELQALKTRFDELSSEEAEDEAKFQALEEEKQALVQRREQAHQRLKEQCYALRNDQFPLFELLEEACTGGPTETFVETAFDPSNDAPEQHVPDEGSLPDAEPYYDYDIPEALPLPPPRHDELNAKYKNILSYLTQAENDLENRADVFYYQKQARLNQLSWGEQVSTISALERHQFIETQEVTQRVARWENEVEAVRQEAFEAGIQLDSYEIESRFIDDVNDGYGISGERKMIASVDVSKIEKWLAQLPENPIAADIAAELPAADEDWDAVSVDIWESRSMVADGFERRKIDQWRQMAPA